MCVSPSTFWFLFCFSLRENRVLQDRGWVQCLSCSAKASKVKWDLLLGVSISFYMMSVCICVCVCHSPNHSVRMEGLGQSPHALSPYWGPYTCRENGFLLFFSPLLISPSLPTLSFISLYNSIFSLSTVLCFSLRVFALSPHPSNLTTFSLTLFFLPSFLSLSLPLLPAHLPPFLLLPPCAHLCFSASLGQCYFPVTVSWEGMSLYFCSPRLFLTVSLGCTPLANPPTTTYTRDFTKPLKVCKPFEVF